MYLVKFTSAYKKSYKLMRKRGFDVSLLDEVVETLMQGATLESRYRDHGLSGRFPGISGMSCEAGLASGLLD